MKWLLSAVLVFSGAPALAAAPIDGHSQFRAQCGLCHLEGGTGTLMLGRRLGKDQGLLESRRDLTVDYVRAVVRNGINSMPAFTRVQIDDATLSAVADYLAKPKK